ncbi:MAG: BspA family leucine-rich repeat surface protein, partial [Lachnospiraceae bacterium]|nr:BspA family leucine-rich repeat surface protein [Lachnospiraceae bacterium]
LLSAVTPSSALVGRQLGGTHTLMSDSLVGYDEDDVYYVLGSEEWRRDEITSVTFLDTLTDEPDDSWDVSDEQDGSVKAWVDENGGADLYIAAKGGVALPEDCEDLFSCYENMTAIDLTYADTSSVTNMNGMFYYCYSLEELDVSGFDTSNVTDMAFMFTGCAGLTSLDVSSFDTSSVTDMYGMFAVCTGLALLDVSGFDTSSVTDMGSMFSYCTALTSLDVSMFDTSAAANLSYMFAYSSSLTLVNTDGFDFSNAETMDYMYAGCTNLSRNILMPVEDGDSGNDPVFGSNWERKEISAVTFLSTLANEPDGSWDVSEAGDGSVKAWVAETGDDCSLYIAADGSVRLPADSGNLFGCYWNLTSIDMAGVDTSGVVDMSYMFHITDVTKLDLSGFDTSNVQTMRNMFCYCECLTELDLSNFDTSNVTDMSFMFSHCSDLTDLDISSFDTSNVTTMSYMFNECSSLAELDLSNFDTSAVTSSNGMFDGCAAAQDSTAADRSDTAEDDAADDYILPTSSAVYLTEADLEGLTQDELRYARNEIYARHGRKFDDAELQAYFDAKSWYSGTVESADFSDDMLNEYEKANLIQIKAREEALAG